MIRGIGWDTSIEEYLYDDAIRTSRIGIPLGLDTTRICSYSM